MKRELIIAALIINLLFATSVSAGVYFSNIESVYNLGDIINVQANINPVLEEYLLKIDLTCDDKLVIPFNLMPDAEGKAEIKIPLNYNTIKEVSNNCYLTGDYGGEIIKSRRFEISKKLSVILSVDSYFIKPGEQIEISGNIKRQNGVGINGNVQLTVPLLSLMKTSNETEETENETEEVSNSGFDNGIFYGKIADGQFSIKLDMAKETPAGNYRIDIEGYETSSSGKRMSEGYATANLRVFQILTNADIVLNNQNFNPGEEISFIAQLLDQTGITISDDVSIYMKDADEKILFEKIVKSGENIKYILPTNLTSGYYEITASSGDFSSSKKFFVNEKSIVSFELKNQTLAVKNIGNIPYNKDIQVELNGKPFVKRVILELGETKEYRLSGTNENYDVRISDGERELNQSGIALTGHAVGIAESSGLLFGNPIIWICLIIILLGLAFFFFRKSFRKKSIAYPWEKKKKILELKGKSDKKDSEENSQKAKDFKELLNIPKTSKVFPNKAEQGLVSDGYKNNVVVLVLKIKNKLDENTKEVVEKAISRVYDLKGAVYEQGDYIQVIFSPLVTRSLKNEFAAVKSSQEILKVLSEHNKKFEDKIEFGIAVNSGEMINRIEDKKLKFTGLGNILPVAKKIAEAAKEQVFLTREVYERCNTEVKAERKRTDAGEFFELKEVMDNTKNRKFIQDFLKRNF
jgi:hypothetical protein